MWGITQDHPREGHRGSAGTCTCSEHPPRFLLCPPFFLCNPDINELNLPKTCDISFSDPDDLLNFKLVICPDEVSVPGTGQGLGSSQVGRPGSFARPCRIGP